MKSRVRSLVPHIMENPCGQPKLSMGGIVHAEVCPECRNLEKDPNPGPPLTFLYLSFDSTSKK